MKFLILSVILLGIVFGNQQNSIQKCILDSTTTDIFGEITEIRENCSQNLCMNWFLNREIEENLTAQEIKECFQICGSNNQSFVQEFIQEVIIQGCIFNEELQEEFQVIQEEFSPKLRSAAMNAISGQNEQSFISKFIGNLFASKNEGQQYNLTQQEQQQYGSWGSWGSWDSEYYYYPPVAVLEYDISSSTNNNGKISKNTTQGFKDGENGTILYEITDNWRADSSIGNEGYQGGSLGVWFLDEEYGSYIGLGSIPVIFEEHDFNLDIEGSAKHTKTYTIEEKQENSQDKYKEMGLKVPEELKNLDFGSDFEVTDVNENWEWDLNKDADTEMQISFPLWGSLFGSLF